MDTSKLYFTLCDVNQIENTIFIHGTHSYQEKTRTNIFRQLHVQYRLFTNFNAETIKFLQFDQY